MFNLKTDIKPLKYLFTPDEKIPKTASARITGWAKVLMGIYFKLKNTPREEMPHADVLSRPDFDDDDDNSRVCLDLENIYFLQSDLLTLSDIRTDAGSIRLFQNVIERKKAAIGNKAQTSRSQTTERRFNYPQRSHLSRCCDFHSTQTKACGCGQSSWDPPRQKCY